MRSPSTLGGRAAGGLAGLAITVTLIVGCGPAKDPDAGATAAASACTTLTGLESTLLQQRVRASAALVTLDQALANARTAAADDPRWKRLDADIGAIKQDLLNGNTATLRAKAEDAAAICSPSQAQTVSP